MLYGNQIVSSAEKLELLLQGVVVILCMCVCEGRGPVGSELARPPDLPPAGLASASPWDTKTQYLLPNMNNNKN